MFRRIVGRDLLEVVQALLLHAFSGTIYEDNRQKERVTISALPLCVGTSYKSQGTRDRKLFFNLIIIKAAFVCGIAQAA